MTVVDHEIAANEHGILRLFTLDLQSEAGHSLRETLDSGGPDADRAAAEALGVDAADAQWVGLVALKDLEAVGLEAYLTQGYDVPADQLAAAQDQLAGVRGHVLAVPSRTFDGVAQRLNPAPGVKPLAQFRTDATLRPATPMFSAEPGGEGQHEAAAEDRHTGEGRDLSGRMILGIVIAVALVLALLGLF